MKKFPCTKGVFIGISHRLFAVACLFHAISVTSQHKQIRFEHINKEQGISSSEITHVLQDNFGFMWIATTDGLNRYDGYEMKIYRNTLFDSTSICDNSITTLYLDKKNQIWIGTKNGGLSIYNASQDNFINFSFNIYDSASLSFNHVTSIIEDDNDNVWVGTLLGLNKYKPETQGFKRYFMTTTVTVTRDGLDSLKANVLPPFMVSSLEDMVGIPFLSEHAYYQYLSQKVDQNNIDKHYHSSLAYLQLENQGEFIRQLLPGTNGTMWVGFEQIGLGLFDYNSGKMLHHYKHDPRNNNSISNNEIMSLAKSNEDLWIGTRSGGLNRLDLTTGSIDRVRIGWAAPYIKDLLIDYNGNIWFGNDRGLGLYDKKTRTFSQYKNQRDYDFSLSNSSVTSMFEDAQRNLWVGTHQGGINLSTSNHFFELINHQPDYAESMTKNNVSAILEDKDGDFWIGYYTDGIDLWKNGIKTFLHGNGLKNNLGKGTVFEIFEAKNGTIWIGSYQGGLQSYNKKTKIFKTYKHDPKSINSIGGNDIRAIAEDADGNLWLAIHGAGISRFNPKTETFSSFRANCADWTHALSNDWVFTVNVDSKQRVWIGSVSGISIYYPYKDKFVSYNNENSALSHNNVTTIFEDSNGRIWIGTEIGLNLYNEEASNFQVFTENQGLPNNNVKSIEEDKEGNLWISTNNGITKFNQQKSVHNYNVKDGLQSNEFFVRASFRSKKNGTIYFGGKDGLSSFNPKHIEQNRHLPPVHITGFKLFDTDINVGDGTQILHKKIELTKEIQLDYDKNSFTIAFAGINYIRPEKNLYSYKMTGVDHQWTPASVKRTATYTNIKPGTYTFHVIASNNDGVWNKEGTSIKIIVNPPFWLSTWAYIFYSLMILIAIYFTRQSILRRINLRHKMEVETLKLRFFTNISHEFRTPLTLILGPLNKLMRPEEDLSKNRKHELFALMHRNSQRMLRLINQLMDTYELDAGFSKIKIHKADIIEFSKSVFKAFDYDAERKGIHYHFECNAPSCSVYFDTDIVEKILYNLISNAFKFTPKKGAIMVTIHTTNHEAQAVIPAELIKANSTNPKYIKFVVEDSGEGMPKNALEQVFQRFYQVESQNMKTGTGIGLSLTKQLVSIHKGHISVESAPEEGARFTVYLPVNKEAFDQETIIDSPFIAKTSIEITPPNSDLLSLREESTKEIDHSKELPVMLIVEDNDDIRDYVKFNFDLEYQVREAENGEQGLEIALDCIPDIIISDIMMPKLDGIGMCQQLKTDERTSHVPILLLTAKSDESYLVKGFENGADDYVSKPFSMNALKARVNNLIKVRRELQEKFSKGTYLIPRKSLTNKTDENFIKNIVDIIEKNITNTSFNPDSLVTEIGMSRSILYKKINALTGMSVSIFIRSIRLKKAAMYLLNEDTPINQVAYKVGFTDPAYFTNCFKKQFEISPSDFAAKRTNTIFN